MLCHTVPQHGVGVIGAAAMEENRAKGRALGRPADKKPSHCAQRREAIPEKATVRVAYAAYAQAPRAAHSDCYHQEQRHHALAV